MSRIIDKSMDDISAGIRFHTSSARMSIKQVSFVAFQRVLDEMERSKYMCPECGWRGWGKELVPMEIDQDDVFLIEHTAETWYSCPKCECEIHIDHPIMKAV